jgi:hypothetical protein
MPEYDAFGDEIMPGDDVYETVSDVVLEKNLDRYLDIKFDFEQ